MNFRIIVFLFLIHIAVPVCGFAQDTAPLPCIPVSAEEAGHPNAPSKYATPPVWQATKTTFVDGRLIYKAINSTIAPGVKKSADVSWDLAVNSGKNFRDTVMKFPDTCKTIYASGLIQNYLEYKIMFGDNWQFAKLSADDFADAGHIYAQEGNWGILQTGYYCLKGTSRVVWALAIMNSGQAVYKIVKAGGETVYYLLRYPVGGALKAAASPVILVGGTAWSTIASLVTTGWALPFTAVFDTFMFAGGVVWSEH
jgi:hypothetical protein